MVSDLCIWRGAKPVSRQQGADVKADGVKLGRKPILTSHQQREAGKHLEAGETQRSVVRNYNVSQSTISRLTAQQPCGA